MIDLIIMGGILLFLLFTLVFGAKYFPAGNNSFFDQYNSKAMRGFWCLIVVLVHIPQAYQNLIQDMIGSFGYIGVTFFFMTSAYGLSAGIHNKPDSINNFWRIRLPKLLIPNWTSNLIVALFFLVIFGERSSFVSYFVINGWVKWLLACYAAFWLVYYFNQSKKHYTLFVSILVIMFSLSIYYLKLTGNVNSTTWCTESIGFVWGILLFSRYDKIKQFFSRKWIVKSSVTCLLSLILGVSYLQFKHVIFWGDYILKIILGLSIVCFILVLNSTIKIGNRISWFLGDISFEIYLIHGAVFQFIQKTLPNIRSGMFILLSITLTVLASLVIHRIGKILQNYYISFIKRQIHS